MTRWLAKFAAIIFVAAILSAIFPFASRAQVGCIPNPNDTPPQWVAGCPITAAGLNHAFGTLGSGVTIVTTNAALQALTVSAGTAVARTGYYADSDGPITYYKTSATACTLNSGAGDGFSQVQITAGGCANIVPQKNGYDARQGGYNTSQNGTVNHNAVQAVIAYASGATETHNVQIPVAGSIDAYVNVPPGMTLSCGGDTQPLTRDTVGPLFKWTDSLANNVALGQVWFANVYNCKIDNGQLAGTGFLFFNTEHWHVYNSSSQNSAPGATVVISGVSAGVATVSSIVRGTIALNQSFICDGCQATTGPTSTGTAVGSNILTFAATPNGVAIGDYVVDTTTSQPIVNAFVTGVTSTTVTLSSNVQTPGVNSGDTIKFSKNYYPTISAQLTGPTGGAGTYQLVFPGSGSPASINVTVGDNNYPNSASAAQTSPPWTWVGGPSGSCEGSTFSPCQNIYPSAAVTLLGGNFVGKWSGGRVGGSYISSTNESDCGVYSAIGFWLGSPQTNGAGGKANLNTFSEVSTLCSGIGVMINQGSDNWLLNVDHQDDGIGMACGMGAGGCERNMFVNNYLEGQGTYLTYAGNVFGANAPAGYNTVFNRGPPSVDNANFVTHLALDNGLNNCADTYNGWCAAVSGMYGFSTGDAAISRPQVNTLAFGNGTLYDSTAQVWAGALRLGGAATPSTTSGQVAMGSTVSGPTTCNGSGNLGWIQACWNFSYAGTLYQIPLLTDGSGGGAGGVSSVVGTPGQINVSPTTGSTVVSLPTTITQATTFSSGLTTPSATITGGLITGMPTPVNPSDVATKAYVDSAGAGQYWHAPVQCTFAAALPFTPTYANGTAGVGATLTAGSNGVLTCDTSYTPVLNDRLLVPNQASALQNGVYTLTTVGTGGVPYVLTRATDFDQVIAGEVATGAAFWSINGTANGTKGFVFNTTGAITIGTTALTFVQFTGGQAYTAAAPITLAGTVFSFQSIPANSVPANTTGGLATPSGNVGYGQAANQLLQLDGTGRAGFANLPAVTGPTIIGRVTNTPGSPSAAYTPSDGTDTTVGVVSGTTIAGNCLAATNTAGTYTASSVACPPVPSPGAGLYVDPVHGLDANPCSVTQPCQTIAHAQSVASPPVTIWLQPGQYVSEIYSNTANVSFRGVQPIPVIGIPTSATVAELVPPATDSGPGTHTGVYIDQLAANVTVQDILVNGEDGPNAGNHLWRNGIITEGYNPSIIHNFVIHINKTPANSFSGGGIETDDFYNIGTAGIVTRNKVWDVGVDVNNANQLAHCYYFSNWGVVATNNIAGGCLQGFGIETWHGASHQTIANNLIVNSLRGIQVGNGDLTAGKPYSPINDYTMVFNNLLAETAQGLGSGNTKSGIVESAGGSPAGSIGPHNQYSNNCVTMAGGYSLSTNQFAFTGNGMPTFVNYQTDGSGDYHLVDGAWCSGQGTTSLGNRNAPNVDLDGKSRCPMCVSMGPYESNLTLPQTESFNPGHGNSRFGLVAVTNGSRAFGFNLASGMVPIFGSFSRGGGSGMYYVEFVVHPTDANFLVQVGVGNDAALTTDGHDMGFDTNSVAYYASNVAGFIRYNGTNNSGYGPITTLTDERIGVAYDTINCKFWFRRHSDLKWNNDVIANQNPATNTGGFAVPATICATSVNASPGIGAYTTNAWATMYAEPIGWVDGAPASFGQWR